MFCFVFFFFWFRSDSIHKCNYSFLLVLSSIIHIIAAVTTADAAVVISYDFDFLYQKLLYILPVIFVLVNVMLLQLEPKCY